MEFQVNNLITLKLENNKTVIYIDEKPFILCKCLYIDIPTEKFNLDSIGISSVDELRKKHDLPFKYHLKPETEFWAHASNLQVFVENDYDTALLHSNIAFPILYRLTETGDRKARKVYKEEVGKRFSSGYLPVIKFLCEESYLSDLNNEEKGIIYDNLVLSLSKIKNKEQTISVLGFLCDFDFPKAVNDMKIIIQKELKKGNEIFSKFLFKYDYIRYLDRYELLKCLESKDVLIKIQHNVRDELELHEEFESGVNPGFSIKGNRVTGLNLCGGLLKTFPKEIFELKSLTNLNLSQNQLISLPEDLKYLGLLKNLFLDFNNIRTLPDSVENLKNLRRLNLASNKIKNLPDTMGELKSLISLNLSYNRLGKLPQTIEGLENLEELYLDGNRFLIFPKAVTKLKSLKKLTLGDNRLTAIPECIGNLKSLTELNLSINQLESLPKSIGGLKSLKILNLFQHRIKSFPKSLIDLPCLEVLNVRSGKVTSHFKILDKLKGRKIRVYK